MIAKLVPIAACQYGIEYLENWQHYERKITRIVEDAAARGARLLLFPEYGAMELASLLSPLLQASLPGQLEALQTYLEPMLSLHSALARKHLLYILAPSFPVRVNKTTYHNRAHFISPAGAIDFQDKLIMTRFERETWGISAGNAVKVFATSLGRIGIAVCYEAEFPLAVRSRVDAGAEIILVPSCTDTEEGYYRVRIAAQARALENQCYVIQAVTVGQADWSAAVDTNFGAAAVYTPPNSGLPRDGIAAKGPRDEHAVVYASLDLARLREVRRDGQTLNHLDWPEQSRTELNGITVVDL